ncbi:MAG: hypothetical protein ACK5P7_02675 [Bdellovibrio sp.]
MKKSFKILFCVFVMSVLSAGFYYYNNHLFTWEAKVHWSQEPFDASRFKNGSMEERAKMAASLITGRYLLGMNADEVSYVLGEETGDYYKSDSNLTYRLTNKGNADWILTLTADDNGKICQVFIRKSCCSVSRRAADFVLGVLFEGF